MAVKLSERAAEEVKRFQIEHNFGDDMVLRIGIAAGGCSGFSYTLNFDDSFDEKAGHQVRLPRCCSGGR